MVALREVRKVADLRDILTIPVGRAQSVVLTLLLVSTLAHAKPVPAPPPPAVSPPAVSPPAVSLPTTPTPEQTDAKAPTQTPVDPSAQTPVETAPDQTQTPQTEQPTNTQPGESPGPNALPEGVTATTPTDPKQEPPKPRTRVAPVPVADKLPQVPHHKLKSDVAMASITKLIHEGQFAQALVEVDALLKKSPHDDELLVKRARLLYWLDRREEAKQALAPVLVRYPDDMEVRELDAQIKLSAGDLAGALKQYRVMEAAGDGRPELHQRIIDLGLQLEEYDAVAQSLKYGGVLSAEQEMAYAKITHPWFADVGGTLTLDQRQVGANSFWPRTDAHIGRRLNKRWAVLAGFIWEQRYSGAELQRSWAPKAELYFGAWRLDGMLHVEGSYERKFMPVIDVRADLALSIVKAFSLGLYGRFARYMPIGGTNFNAWTLAPNLIFYVKDWTIQPGYMLIHVPLATTSKLYYHTGFLKARWEPTPRWMAFAWLFAGTDPTYLERFGVTTATGISAVLGAEHWWTPRFGTRLSIGRNQPFDSKNDAYSDITLVLRGRL